MSLTPDQITETLKILGESVNTTNFDDIMKILNNFIVENKLSDGIATLLRDFLIHKNVEAKEKLNESLKIKSLKETSFNEDTRVNSKFLKDQFLESIASQEKTFNESRDKKQAERDMEIEQITELEQIIMKSKDSKDKKWVASGEIQRFGELIILKESKLARKNDEILALFKKCKDKGGYSYEYEHALPEAKEKFITLQKETEKTILEYKSSLLQIIKGKKSKWKFWKKDQVMMTTSKDLEELKKLFGSGNAIEDAIEELKTKKKVEKKVEKKESKFRGRRRISDEEMQVLVKELLEGEEQQENPSKDLEEIKKLFGSGKSIYPFIVILSENLRISMKSMIINQIKVIEEEADYRSDSEAIAKNEGFKAILKQFDEFEANNK